MHYYIFGLFTLVVYSTIVPSLLPLEDILNDQLTFTQLAEEYNTPAHMYIGKTLSILDLLVVAQVNTDIIKKSQHVNIVKICRHVIKKIKKIKK
jgi:hypothetical protein